LFSFSFLKLAEREGLSMNIVKDGHPFIFAFAIITFAVGYWGSLIWAVVPAVLMLFFIYFFRNPNRPTQSDDSIIYSPADGTVMAIEDFYDEEYLNEDAIKVTIFLSVFNVFSTILLCDKNPKAIANMAKKSYVNCVSIHIFSLF